MPKPAKGKKFAKSAAGRAAASRAVPSVPTGQGPVRAGLASSASTTAAEVSEILTLLEAAAFLRISEEDLKADALAGRVPGRLVAGQWRFSRSALIAWLSHSEMPSDRPTSSGTTLAAQLHEKPLPPPYADNPQQVEQEIAELAKIRKTLWLVG
jgi:hypothetical protein